MMILFVKLTKGIGHKFYQLMKSSPIYTIYSHSRVTRSPSPVKFLLVMENRTHLCIISAIYMTRNGLQTINHSLKWCYCEESICGMLMCYTEEDTMDRIEK
jgi:hypothetical protein